MTAKVRYGWLRFMYAYTIVGAGAMGVSIIIAPRMVESVFGFPKEVPVAFGIMGSVYTAFAILSVAGLRSPLKFAPVLALQLCYKLLWLLAIILPRLAGQRLEAYAIIPAVIFLTYVIGDLIAIPFCVIFAKE